MMTDRLHVRGPTAAAYGTAWAAIGDPGSWWSGEERVAMAAEVRATANCALCHARKAALSPYDDQLHAASAPLSVEVVDAVHRITTDPGRLTREWFDRLVPAALEVEEFVELVAVVATAVAVGAFFRGVGLPQPELPRPRPGRPTRVRLPTVQGEGWVPMLDATATAMRTTRQARGPLGKGPHPMKALSLLPAEHAQLHGLFSSGRALTTLTIVQAQVVASSVAVANDCQYCTFGHLRGLQKAAKAAGVKLAYERLLAGDEAGVENVRAGALLTRLGRAVASADARACNEVAPLLVKELGTEALVDAVDIAAQVDAGSRVASATGLQPTAEWTAAVEAAVAGSGGAVSRD